MTTRTVHDRPGAAAPDLDDNSFDSRSGDGGSGDGWVPGRGLRALRAVAVAATVPYLVLKTAWLTGSHVGIPEGSVLREPGLFFTVANAVTLVMDATLVLLVLLLTQAWGMRIRAWLLTVLVFVAAGLLAPIVIAFPAQLLGGLVGGGESEAAAAAREPFLDSWVYDVVYTGFGLQALALAGLFLPYARRRWGRRWQGRPAIPGGRATRPAAVLAALTGLAVTGVQGYWALGGSAGLDAAMRARYDWNTAVLCGTYGLLALSAAVGGVLLAYGARLGLRRARGPLALAWIGAGGSLTWGAWLTLASLSVTDPAKQSTFEMYLTYAGQMITGLLVAGVLARCLTARQPE
ncbi:hypothetical protein [Streptomyces sp. NPDC086023]|uniref:hypothetical protein n=1 Tax=Streptomyces sp. NPDC086023 TaxID=3365746 RepID=UPI0037D5333A